MPDQEGPDFENLKKLLSGIDPAVLHDLMPLTGGVITMMFTDIVDSTRVKKLVGDQPYFAALGEHNALIRECLTKFHGHELKTIGDSFFIAYKDPRRAVDCAIEIQKRIASSPIQVGTEILSVRIGMHTGIPIVYNDEATKRIDLSGTDVQQSGARGEPRARRSGSHFRANENLRRASPNTRLGPLGNEGPRGSTRIRSSVARENRPGAFRPDVAGAGSFPQQIRRSQDRG